jgi:uncharacterized protein (TIGR02145 family)
MLKAQNIIGSTIGNYRISSFLGKGGMASVFLAEHVHLDSKHAIKMLNEEFLDKDGIKRRFLSEAKELARMSSPLVVKVSDMINQAGCVAFVMEFVEGKTLKNAIEIGEIKSSEVRSFFLQMLEALCYVHNEQLIHRDITPSNFMVSGQGKVKLLDFGIAKNTDPASAEYTQTGTGVMMGTPLYMSPEQITETKSVTIATDIYSLGVVLWQMVTGRKPYDTATLNTFQLQTKIVQEPLPMTGTSWDPVIQRATQKDPSKRYSSCTEFIQVVQHIKQVENTNRLMHDNVTIVNEMPTIVVKGVPVVEIPSVRIGSQVWMTENLDVAHFKNGDPIQEIRSDKEWLEMGNLGMPAYCYYENDNGNFQHYGKLYNWFAVSDPRGLAPEGWGIPSEKDWEQISIFLSSSFGQIIKMVNGAGRKMKSSSGWRGNGNGTNESGFSGLPGGFRDGKGAFSNEGYFGYWWSETAVNKRVSRKLSLDFFGSRSNRGSLTKNYGLSVRCIKIQPEST